MSNQPSRAIVVAEALSIGRKDYKKTLHALQIELVKLQRKAGEADGLRKEVDTLKSRLAEAESRLTPAIGAPESGGRTKSIADMGDAEARAALKRAALEADAA